MKKINNYSKAILFAALSVILFSCEKDNNVTPSVTENDHFDIWVSISEGGGMDDNETLLVQNTETLDDPTTVIDYKGTGVDVTSKLYQESIIKGKYYYQIPQGGKMFGKYRIGSTGIEVVSEVYFGTNTFSARKYAHAWINENTLVIMAANGDKDAVIWTKINTDDMTIISEGTLAISDGTSSGLTDVGKFCTSGLANYRAADNTILYSYCYGTSRDIEERGTVYMAFIDASTMTVVKNIEDSRTDCMSGSAFGQLLQSKAFFTDNGDYYLACGSYVEGTTSSTQQYGTLLRIKSGETEFDQSYSGFVNASNKTAKQGKLVTVEALTNNKALVYVQDPEYTNAAGWGSNYNCYYAILDIETDEITVLDVPFSEGTFSQRSLVLRGKAYIGVNPENTAPSVYVYDIATGNITKGLTITEGYSFDRIVTIMD